MHPKLPESQITMPANKQIVDSKIFINYNYEQVGITGLSHSRT